MIDLISMDSDQYPRIISPPQWQVRGPLGIKIGLTIDEVQNEACNDWNAVRILIELSRFCSIRAYYRLNRRAELRD